MKRKYYLPPNGDFWQGRIDSEKAERWHQAIQLLDLTMGDVSVDEGLAILGFSCDEGVRRNKGRTGAAGGPQAIRRALGNLPFAFTQPIFDAGDIICPGEKLAKAQRQLGKAVARLLQQRLRPVVLGGGHETAYGSWLGLRSVVPFEESIGIINLDAHFDLRSNEDGPTSGTPFYQIRQECDSRERAFHYLVLGIDPDGNTETLFTRASDYGVRWLPLDVGHTRPEDYLAEVETFLSGVDHVYLTIDLDVFSVAIAPGVSAINALGIFPGAVLPVLSRIGASGKLRIFDICECNPVYDRDQQTARLAARLIGKILTAWS